MQAGTHLARTGVIGVIGFCMGGVYAIRFLARISGSRYDEDATLDARRRIIEFFNRYLKDSQTRPPH